MLACFRLLPFLKLEISTWTEWNWYGLQLRLISARWGMRERGGERERERETVKNVDSPSQACSTGSPSLRGFAAEALTLLIRISLEAYSEEVSCMQVVSPFPFYNIHSHFPFQKVQLMLLRPLESMTRVPHSDVRQKQMDCITHVNWMMVCGISLWECDCLYFLFQILHSSGHSLGSSWSVILEVISSATRLQK